MFCYYKLTGYTKLYLTLELTGYGYSFLDFVASYILLSFLVIKMGLWHCDNFRLDYVYLEPMWAHTYNSRVIVHASSKLYKFHRFNSFWLRLRHNYMYSEVSFATTVVKGMYKRLKWMRWPILQTLLSLSLTLQMCLFKPVMIMTVDTCSSAMDYCEGTCSMRHYLCSVGGARTTSLLLVHIAIIALQLCVFRIKKKIIRFQFSGRGRSYKKRSMHIICFCVWYLVVTPLLQTLTVHLKPENK